MVEVLAKYLSEAKRNTIISAWQNEKAAKNYLLDAGFKFIIQRKRWVSPTGILNSKELSAISYLHYIHNYGWYK